MARLRVLFLPYYFPPMGGMGSLRALGFARHLPAAGVDVTVVAPRTGTYGHDDSLVVPEGIEVIRTGTLEPPVLRRWRAGVAKTGATSTGPSRGGGLLGKLLYVPDSNNGWIPFAVCAALRAARQTRFDFVFTTSPPLTSHLAGGIVAKRLRLPHITDFRDFFAWQRLYTGRRERVDRWFENRVLGGASRIVATADGIRDRLLTRVDRPSLVIPNGYDEEDFAGTVEPRRDPFTLVHVGTTHATKRSPAALLGAVRELLRDGVELRLRFVGNLDPTLQAGVSEAGIADHVDFVPFSTHRDAVAEMRSASALLFFMWAANPLVAQGVRLGKTLEYLRSGRPILCAGFPGSENVRVFEEAGGAVFAPPDDEAAIRAALAGLAGGERPAAPDGDWVRLHSRPAGARRLAEWLGDLRSGGVGSRR